MTKIILETVLQATKTIREQERVIIDARNTIAEAQAKTNLALAELEMYLSMIRDGLLTVTSS